MYQTINAMGIAFVIPVSKKAKNRIANLMDNNNQCIVEQIKKDKAFLVSMNSKYCFWVNLKNDSDWIVEL
jgi:hypothetical protein